VHGLIHVELERFARARLGDPAWDAAVAHAGLTGKEFLPTGQYPDADALALVVSLASGAGAGPQALLEQFGEALVPPLLATYGDLVDPAWGTIELVGNTEALIHTVLRATDEAARPPLLRTSVRGQDQIVVIYASERRMCGVAKGIIRGLATHFGENVEIDEESCMLTGAGACKLAVTRK
jgi:predicted hydrocarbon binding protein